ncbi:MAG: hypothetical protein Ct9H300mP16_13040 [Pseudomonadota bacterium]|nr:MAG: hypothetical protein Ct9H300mP16_13040 [Pseudomonadota bacterium]
MESFATSSQPDTDSCCWNTGVTAAIRANPPKPACTGTAVPGSLSWPHREFPPERVILYGESLGSGIPVRLAAEHRPAALILEAPYTSIADVAQRHYWFLPAHWLVRDRYETRPYLASIRSPVLVIHGESDRIIDVSFGKRVFNALPEPKTAWFVPRARPQRRGFVRP